jgi:hypothetical protein
MRLVATVCREELWVSPPTSKTDAPDLLISNMEGRSGAPDAAPERTKGLSRNEKDRERRRVGGARHAQALADKQAEIDTLRGSLTGVLDQMANFKGVADVAHPRLLEVNPALG